MKLRLFSVVGVLSIALTVMFWGFSATAKTLSFEESFFARASETVSQKEDMSGVYGLDKAHSAVGFRVKHYGLVDVPGYFRDFKGTVNYNAKDMTKSTVEFTAQMKSVDTGNQGRDNHLRTADFFEVEKFPEMTFKSTKVAKKGKQWLVTGDLMMKGVTKTLTFPFNLVGFAKDARGGVKMGVTAETVINRREFGVNYGGNLPSGVAMLSDNITVVLQLECNLTPPPAPPAAK
jgi:polyisoprenoid-binding protein YceI